MKLKRKRFRGAVILIKKVMNTWNLHQTDGIIAKSLLENGQTLDPLIAMLLSNRGIKDTAALNDYVYAKSLPAASPRKINTMM